MRSPSPASNRIVVRSASNASSKEAIRKAARRLNLPADVIVPVGQVQPDLTLAAAELKRGPSLPV